MEKLLQAGADWKVSGTLPRGAKAIHLAAAQGHWEVIQRLINWGASLRDEDAEGCNPLHYAAGGGQVTVMESILKDFPDLLNYGSNCSPLYRAAEGGNFEALNFLLEKGAKVMLRAEGLRWPTALEVATHNGNRYGAEALICAGAYLTIDRNFVFTKFRWDILKGTEFTKMIFREFINTAAIARPNILIEWGTKSSEHGRPLSIDELIQLREHYQSDGTTKFLLAKLCIQEAKYESASQLYDDSCYIGTNDSSNQFFYHPWVRCDGCSKKDFVGYRYKATTRRDFDFCENCYKTDQGNDGFIKIPSQKWLQEHGFEIECDKDKKDDGTGSVQSFRND